MGLVRCRIRALWRIRTGASGATSFSSTEIEGPSPVIPNTSKACFEVVGVPLRNRRRVVLAYFCDDLLARAELTRQIYGAVKDRELSQSEAGQLLALKQPDVSLLMRGKFTRLSTDRLMQLLDTLNQIRHSVRWRDRALRVRG